MHVALCAEPTQLEVAQVGQAQNLQRWMADLRQMGTTDPLLFFAAWDTRVRRDALLNRLSNVRNVRSSEPIERAVF